MTKFSLLDSSKPTVFTDDNFQVDKNWRKFFKKVENTVGKGEFFRYYHFFSS